MKTSLNLFLFLAAMLGGTLAAAAAETNGESHVYKKIGDRELRLFVFKPSDWKSSDRRPAIVFFHGGGWVKGGPSAFSDQSAYLATRGMVAVSVEYRLLERKANVAPITCMHDAKSAMRWVQTHAGELGIDPERIAAGGGSAGGHLALFTAMVPGIDDPADDLNVSPKPSALVLFNPVVDGLPEAPRDVGIAARFGDGAAAFLKAAPARHVTAKAPPMIILHGTEDTTIPMASIKRFQASLKKVGVRCDAVFFEGQGHGFFNRNRSEKSYYETVLAADKFLASLGWLKGPPGLQMPTNTSSVVKRVGDGNTPAAAAAEGYIFVQGGAIQHQIGSGEAGAALRVDDFEILDHPVTNAEYRTFVDSTGHAPPLHWTGGRIPAGKEDYPVIFVNRADVRAYLEWISQRDGRVYRLPTSGEFEYAARGGKKGRTYPWGDAAPQGRANYDADGERRYDRWQDHLRPARWGEPNGFGLYGMAGNVWHLALRTREPLLSGFGFRITEPEEAERALMGGSWARGAEYLKTGYVLNLSPGNRHPDIGFRPVRNPPGSDWRVQTRQLIAVPRGEGAVMLGWALRAADDPGIGFHVYRLSGGMRSHAGFRVTKEPVRATTTYIDTEVAAGKRYQYYIRAVDAAGREGRMSEWVGVQAGAEPTAVVASFRPVALKGSGLVPVFGDFNGDGARDVAIRIDNGVKERSRHPDAGVQDPGVPVQIETFTSDGRPLWRRDLGSHELAYGNANNLPVVVWDMDGDGRDEVVARLQVGDSMHVAILDGMSGRVLRTVPWPDMATDFSKSSTRVHMSIAYLDGKNPAVVTQTGLYENEIFVAYDAQLRQLWRFDSFAETSGSGSHRIEVGDVDGDGRQEVFNGTTLLNFDGTLRWSIYRQHPDLVALRDFLPDRPGLEVCFEVESSIHAGIYMVDASTGKEIWKVNREDDPRWTHAHIGWTADIWSGSPGIEAVSNRDGHGDRHLLLFSADGEVLMEPFPYGYVPLEWDGDGTRELIHQGKFSLGDFDGTRFVSAPAAMQPEIPAGAGLLCAADLFGDFRDELVLRVTNEKGDARIDVVTAVHPAGGRYIAPAETLDYRLWLSRNLGGGYRSVFDQPLRAPGGKN